MNKIAITIALLTATNSAFANGTNENKISPPSYIKEVGGYTQIKLDTREEQKYPLLQSAAIQFPSSVRYIGQALNYALDLTGYKLKNLSETEKETLHLYSLKLPLNNRSFAYATTMQVLETLVGTGYVISVDETTRTVSIKHV